MHRFFVSEPISAEQRHVLLQGAEAHHLARVVRVGVGQQVTLLDGTGWEYLARVTDIARRSVELELLHRRQVDRELPLPVVLGVALPKSARQQALIESLVQLGTTVLVPLETDRSVVRLDSRGLARLSRWVQEATKQCGRTRLMQVVPGRSFRDWIAQPPQRTGPRTLKLLAHPEESLPLPEALSLAAARAVDEVRLSVGPEGGFTAEELDQARRHGWQLVQLGRRTLRIETAACLLVGTVGLWLETA